MKKKIVRTVVEEVVANLDDATQTLHFVVHWRGGTHTQFDLKKIASGAEQRTSIDDLEIIREMAVRYGDDDIAYVLNKLGRRTGKGSRWNQHRVATARRNHSIAGQRKTQLDPEILTMGRAAEYLRVSSATIRKLVVAGVLAKRQVVPWAPWEIRRADLDAEPVRRVVARLRGTGKLILDSVDSANQIKLLE